LSVASRAGGAGEFEDGNGHGTHVSGTVAARDDAVGVVGVAPGARIWAARVLNAAGFGSFASVICGVDWATGTRLDADPGNDIEVANMSLSGGGADDGNCGEDNGDAFHAAICNSADAGITYAAAAGNAARDFRTSVPAAYDEVLTVTALSDFDGQPGALGSPTCRRDEDDTFANFSNFRHADRRSGAHHRRPAESASSRRGRTGATTRSRGRAWRRRTSRARPLSASRTAARQTRVG
jgi:subtilisin